jgi:hypothetical protein
MRVTTDDEWRGRTQDLIEALREFGPAMRSEPFQNEQGLRGVSAFALYWYLRQLSPSLVFEVGVWRGYSTWIIEQAVPDAELICLDPVFLLESVLGRKWRRHSYRSPRATYSAQDFSCWPVAESVAGHPHSVAFFDDHQNKLPRLLQCHAAGIKHVIFDDNTRDFRTHRTLEQARREPAAAAVLDRVVHIYEVFPALWPVHARIASERIDEDGLGLPVEDAFANVHRDRRWHSYVTYVHLR